MSNFAFVPVPSNWQKLSRHEFSADMGDMTEAEFAMLCADMEKGGFQGRPVLLTGNKTFEVADGWHQLRAAVVTGKVPSFERYVGNDLFGEIWRRHGPRKHWNESQRSMIAAKVATRTRGNYSKSANLRISPTQEDAAKTVNVSERSVSDAVKVINEGTPALQQAVMNGTVTVSDAVKIVDEPAKVQDAAVKAVRKRKAKTVAAAVRTAADDDPTREPGIDPEEEPVKDAEGHVVPATLIEAFIADFDKAVSLCQQLQSLIDTLATGVGGEQLARLVSPKRSGENVIQRSKHLDDLKADIKGTRPHAVCPYCVGKAIKTCKGCNGVGWVTKRTWEGATDAEKARLAS